MSEKLSELDEALLEAQKEGWELEAEVRDGIAAATSRIRDSYKGRERAIWRKVSKAQGKFDAEKARLAQVEAGYKPGLKMIHPAQKGEWGHARRQYGVIETVTEDSYVAGAGERPEIGTTIIRHIKVDGHPGKTYDTPHYSTGLFDGWRQAKESEFPKQKKKRGPYKKRTIRPTAPWMSQVSAGVTVQ